MPLNPSAAAFSLDADAAAFVPVGAADAAGPAAADAQATTAVVAPRGAWGRGPPAAAVLRMEEKQRKDAAEEAPGDRGSNLQVPASASSADRKDAAEDAAPKQPLRKEGSALSEAETACAHGASSSEEGTGSATSEPFVQWGRLPPAAVATLGASGAAGAACSESMESCTSTELEMSFDDVIDEPSSSRSRCRSPSLSPRERFYGDNDGEVPVLLWAPSPYTNSPLYQGFGFGDLTIDPDELRSPHGLRELAAAGAAREQWFSGGSGRSDDWSDSHGTPASQGGEGAWGEEVDLRAHGKSRVSQASARKSAGVTAGAGGAAANEQFKEFNCKVTVDDFEILHMIGEGGFGKVYQVQQRILNHQPSTLNLMHMISSESLYPQPSTLNPQPHAHDQQRVPLPSTLNPQPSTSCT